MIKNGKVALADVAQWIKCQLQSERSPVPFTVRAHAWVVGQVPTRGHSRGNHTLMFLWHIDVSLPLSPSLL